MIEIIATDWFTITGRGRVVSVDRRQLPKEDWDIHVGQHVRIDGTEYEVRGVEKALTMSGSRPEVGLLVKSVDD